MADFTFPNPSYTKGSAKRELADLIVAVGTILIVFQVKTHQARPESEHDKSRASRKILEAYRQFRTLLEGISDPKLRSLTNSKGIEVPFDLKSFSEIYLVALLDYVQGDDSHHSSWRPRGFNDHDLPISFNAFEAQDFFFLAHQFDTVRDFTTFLDILNTLEKRAPSVFQSGYPHLVSLYRLYPEEVIDAVEKGIHPPHLSDGIVNEFLQRGSPDEEASYIFDAILDLLHTSVGSSMASVSKVFSSKLRAPYNSTEAYWRTITHLACTTRWQRQQLAEVVFQKMEAARIHGFAFGLTIFPDEKRAILIYCSESSRIDRTRELGGVALAFIASHDIDSVTGLSMAPIGGIDGCEFLAIERDWISDLPALQQEVRRNPSLFSAPRSYE